MNHFDLINRLPIDIVLKIIPYTYTLQNKNILNDIVNYVETKKNLLILYHTYWFDIEEDEYKNWLINDIFAYANDYNATMYGYVNKFYCIFERHIGLRSQSKEKIDKYVYNLEKESVETQINIFLGLLNLTERNDLVIAATKKCL